MEALVRAVLAEDAAEVQRAACADEGLVNMPLLEEGWTPIHVASLRGSTDVVRALMDMDADVNSRTVHGQTPLHLCATAGNVDVLTLLVTGGATVSAEDEDGRTALCLATHNKNKLVVSALISYGADMHRKAELDLKDAKLFKPELDEAALLDAASKVATTGRRAVPSEVQEKFVQAFKRWCTKGAVPVLSLEHLGTAMRLGGLNPSETTVKCLQSERDGAPYTQEEFMAVMRSLYVPPAEEDAELSKALSVLTADGHGLSVDWLRKILQDTGEKLSSDEVEAFLSTCNPDENGMLSPADVARVLSV